MTDSTLLLPNFNNEHVLPLAFEQLRQNLDCSRLAFVAVDDGSEDDGLRVLKAEAARSGFAAVEIIERPHEGIVHALNAGLAAVRTEYVFRIDGDALVQLPNWTERLKRYLRHPEIGLVGGHTIFDSGLVHSFGRSVLTESGLHDNGTFPLEQPGSRTLDCNVWRPWRDFPGGAPREVDTVLATCIGFRLEDAQAVGGFDERFNPVWVEDDDFGIALRMLGRKVVVDPALRITHHVSRRGSRRHGSGGAGEGSADHGRAGLVERLRHAWRPARPDFSPIKGRACYGLPEWRVEVLRGHYGRWREKWGFDPLNPDLDVVLERYGDTELCWQYDRSRLTGGRRLLASIAAEG